MTRTVFANKRNFSHKGSRDLSASSAPDVCKTPVGSSTPPLPYPVISEAKDLDQCTKTIFIDGNPTAIESSFHRKCSGDEPGKAKGLISGTRGDITEFVSYSYDVRCEGEGAVRHMDVTTMNKGNTVGMLHGTSATTTDAEQNDERDTEPTFKNIILRLDISPGQGTSCKDQYCLSATDGSYKCIKTVGAEMIEGEDYVDLLYEKLDQSKYYTLDHRSDTTGESYTYFKNISFAALSSLSSKANRSVR